MLFFLSIKFIMSVNCFFIDNKKILQSNFESGKCNVFPFSGQFKLSEREKNLFKKDIIEIAEYGSLSSNKSV